MSRQSPSAPLQDSGLEVSVLTGILTHGPDCFMDISDILSASSFYWRHNQNTFSLLQYLVSEKSIKSFDIPSIISASHEKSLPILKEDDPTEYLESLFDRKAPSKENTLQIAIIIYKLALARNGVKCIISTKDDLLKITGKEDISDIISMVEDPVFEFTSQTIKQNVGIQPICDGLIETLKALAETPQDMVGIPTGYPKWDISIGGGLRRGTVNIIGARPKVGKSFISLNIARNVAENQIPVLYLDTELARPVQMSRLTSLVTGVKLEDIETGKFAKSDIDKKKIWKLHKHIEDLPINHCSIAGQNIQSAISFARRWLSKHVGLNDNGQANPCLLIYDYLKLTDSSDIKNNIQEHQLLGFLISSLHDFAMQWGIPILATVQINRDGVEKEGGQFAAGSDRFLWLGSNFTILKQKSAKELAEDPPSNGTKKLVVTDTRYGPGMSGNEYINIIDSLHIGKFEESKTFHEAIDENFSGNAPV